jgi:hypothetical protein
MAELEAFDHVEDVAHAVAVCLTADLSGLHRLTLCGPGHFDTTAAATVLGWKPTRTWPDRPLPT